MVRSRYLRRRAGGELIRALAQDRMCRVIGDVRCSNRVADDLGIAPTLIVGAEVGGDGDHTAVHLYLLVARAHPMDLLKERTLEESLDRPISLEHLPLVGRVGVERSG